MIEQRHMSTDKTVDTGIRKFLNNLKDESGQAMVEYILLVSLSVLVLITAIPLFVEAMQEYYTEVVRLLCLPIP